MMDPVASNPEEPATGEADLEEDPSGVLRRLSLVNALGFNTEESTVVERALSKLNTDCMHELGFTDYLEVVDEDDARAADAARLAKIQFDDIDLIRTQGFHWLLAPPPGASQGASSSGPPLAQQCIDRANAELGGIGGFVGDIQSYLTNEQSALLARLDADQDIIRLRSSWSDCMADQGFPDLSITESDWVVKFGESPTVSPEEIRAATADYTCRQSLNYYAERSSVLSTLVDQWIDDNPGQVVEISDVKAKIVSQALRIVDGD